MANFEPVTIEDYLAEIGPTLKPPVANRVWFAGPQFFVMVVGGPNNRDDFHFQPGSELFFQFKGAMQLDVMEDDGRKKVPIGEGEMFLLPKAVHHSPQRFSDTIGTYLYWILEFICTLTCHNLIILRHRF